MSDQLGLEQKKFESGSIIDHRTEDEVWNQEPRGQLAIVSEDHWERTEILRRALDFLKISNWREEELLVCELAPYTRAGKDQKKKKKTIPGL